MFKTGQAVRCIADKSTNYGRVGEVVYVHEDFIEVRYDNGELGKGKFKYYELMTSGETICQKKGIMSSIIDIVKNIALSADEKLLRKVEFKNSCGDYTERAKELVMLKLLKDNEQYLLDTAKAVVDEQEADCKCVKN